MKKTALAAALAAAWIAPATVRAEEFDSFEKAALMAAAHSKCGVDFPDEIIGLAAMRGAAERSIDVSMDELAALIAIRSAQLQDQLMKEGDPVVFCSEAKKLREQFGE